MVMVLLNFVRTDNLTIAKLGIRAAVAFFLEIVVDGIKMRIDAMFDIHDHLVRNRMNAWDISNIATTGCFAEFTFLFAVAYVQTQ